MKILSNPPLSYLLPFLIGLSVSCRRVAPDFNEDRFRSLRPGDSLSNVIEKIGNPYYGWKSRMVVGKPDLNHAINPTKGDVLSLEEIRSEMGEDIKIALFYSKSNSPRLPFSEYRKFIVFFHGEHVSKIEEVMQD
jgi:hypothetical protein